jgi:hypothetical protein
VKRALPPLALLLAAVGAAAGCAPPGTAPPGDGDSNFGTPVPAVRTSSPPASPGGCPPSGARVTEGGGDAAMGLRVQGLTLENCGTRTIRLEGYPAVTAFDADGRAQDVEILHRAADIPMAPDTLDKPPTTITLSHGQKATTTLVWRGINESLAAPVTVTALELQPAGRITLDRTMDLGSTGRFAITAWQLG